MLTIQISGINTHNADNVHYAVKTLVSSIGVEIVAQDLCDVTLTYEYAKELLEDQISAMSPTEAHEDLHELLHEVACMPMELGVQVVINNNHDVA